MMDINNNFAMRTFRPLFEGAVALQQASQEIGDAGGRLDVAREPSMGAGSREAHFAQFSKRLDRIEAMLDRLLASSTALDKAPTVMVERAQQPAPAFTYAYSITQDEAGAITEEFSFKVQYRPSGEEALTSLAPTPQPVVARDDAPAGSPPPEIVKAVERSTARQEPVTSEPVDAAPVTQDAPDEAAPNTQSPEERVAELIELYRTDAPSAAEASAPVVSEAAADAGEAALQSLQELIAREEEKLSEVLSFDAARVRRIETGADDDVIDILADTARRIRTGEGDDELSIVADRVARVRGEAGDDVFNIESDVVRRISGGAGDDDITINASRVARINTGEGDDILSINADTVRRVNTGDGDDVIDITADKVRRFNAGAGDDTITLDAEDAAIHFGKGGGEDVINIASVGALAIKVDSDLARSADDVEFVRGEDSVALKFGSGESLTVNGLGNADMVSVRVGGETINLQLSEPPVEMDLSV